MSIAGFTDLLNHVGHDVVVTTYGDSDDPANVAIECQTCWEVLVDFNRPDPKENPTDLSEED